MAEEEGFEPPRALTPLSVFKTDPFSRAWVFLRGLYDVLIRTISNISAIFKNVNPLLKSFFKDVWNC